MDKYFKDKVNRLMNRINTVEKRIRNILKECAMSNDVTLTFWTQKQKELRWEYDILKAVYSMIIMHVISKEYWTKYNKEAKKIKNLKSVKAVVKPAFRKSLVHTRTIKNIFNRAYNTFVIAIDTGYKKKMTLLNKIQMSVIKVNRLKNENSD